MSMQSEEKERHDRKIEAKQLDGGVLMLYPAEYETAREASMTGCEILALDTVDLERMR